MNSKRAFDATVAAAALTLSSPVGAAIAVAIRIDSPGPVFHRAVRVGRGGKPFTLYKFRTMIVDAAQRGPGITASGDPRITRVGKVLRKTKLDELPQFINVLRGEMSIVGPRPEDPRYVAAYDDRQRQILRWQPGLTSPATVAHRHEESMLASAPDPEETYRNIIVPEKIRIDLDYLERATVLSDMKVLWRTAIAILSQSPDGSSSGRRKNRRHRQSPTTNPAP